METLLTSLAGLTFSSIVAAIGYWRKVKHDTRKATKAALFYLLEIRHYAIKHARAMNQFADEYMAHARQVLLEEGIEIPESQFNSLTEYCRKSFREIAAERLDATLEELIPPYCKALDDLAKEDPILAYNLRGRESLHRIAKAIFLHIERSEKPSESQLSTNEKTQFLEFIETIVAELSLDEIDQAIRMAALRCDAVTYLKCRWLLFTQPKSGSSAEITKFAPQIEKILQEAIGRARASATAPASPIPGIAGHASEKGVPPLNGIQNGQPGP